MSDKKNNDYIPLAAAIPIAVEAEPEVKAYFGQQHQHQQHQENGGFAVGTISHDMSQLKVAEESMKHGGNPPRLILQTSASTTNVKLSNNGDQPLSKDQKLELIDMGYTAGLIESIEKTRDDVALRIWIVDNSGSMLGNDGQKIAQSPVDKTVFKLIPSSRWEELSDTVNQHIKLASIIKAPTSFRLLNDPGARVGPQRFGICERGDDPHIINEEVQIATDITSKVQPQGSTPLTKHIHDIYNEVCANRAYLESTGKYISIVLATDGLPTDIHGEETAAEQANLIASLKQFENLPVWIMIRLCTDDKLVVQFYNDIDAQLEMPIEVLDDFVSEATEVNAFNPWLNYALPLHQCREMGMATIRSFDFLDERKFHLSEIRDFVCILFGEEATKNAPDPNIDVNKYCEFLEKKVFKVGKENKIWDPVSQKRKNWVVVKKLRKYRFGFIPSFF